MEAKKGVLRLDARSTQPPRAYERIGFRPHALVLWWSLQNDCGTSAGNCGGIGIATDASEATAVAWAADDAVAPGILSHWTRNTALVGYDDPTGKAPVLLGNVAWTDQGFAVDYTEATGGVWHVHYLALGGAELQHAAVRRFAIDGSGRLAIGELGFRPEFLLFLPSPGSTGAAAVPGLVQAVGVSAGPRSQFAAAVSASVDGTPTSVWGVQRRDAVIALPDPEGPNDLEATARVISLDPDGFTLEAMLRGSAPVQVGCLALAGGQYALGTESGPPAPRKAVRKRVGFEPAGLLVFTWGLAASSARKDIGRLCLGGASAGTDSGCLTWAVRNRHAWPLEPRVRSTVHSLVEVLDTRSGDLHARATLEAFHPDGFSLDWLLSDGYRREFAYVAFGSGRRRSARHRLRQLFRR